MSDMLRRIAEAARAAAAGPLAEARERPSPRLPSAHVLPGGESGAADLVARFRAELEKLMGNVYGPLSAEAAAAQCREIFGALGLAEVLAWDDGEIGCPGLPEALRRAGVRLVPAELAAADERQAALEHLAALPAGLTGAIAGLADTGSIVVASGRGRPRLASLLPPVHVALLPVRRLYPTMAAWLAGGGDQIVRQSANLVVVTGPSRTADIELTIALGVHGPKEIHVILYQDL